jgi:hypothetical protein
MDAFITAGHPDIGDGAITIDTGITATTTVDIGIAVTEESITLNVRQGFAALTTLFIRSPRAIVHC